MRKPKVKPKLGLYIDGANMFYQGKRSGWFLDYKKFLDWVAKENEIIIAKYFIGEPSWEPTKSINHSVNRFLESIGYKIISKPLKKIRADGVVKNKCNFDVEMHDEIIHDLNLIDIVYLVSGDSDFVRTKERVLSVGKKIKFLSYKNGCAWEILCSWHLLLDNIEEDVKRM